MTYVETANRIRVYDSSVTAHEALPAGTYRVHHDQREGFSLMRLDNLVVGGERVYGDREAKVNKIFARYGRTDRSLGVMLSGDKGQGKSLFLRMVAERAIADGLPVVLVSEDADGIAEFIDSLDECLIIFDEFEKTFPAGGRDQENRQEQFLSLFDGMSVTKRIYCVSINSVSDVSTYIVNRPGRFHYHIRFDYPGTDEVRSYLRDNAPVASAEEIERAVRFSQQVNLNYDHLRAIAEELNDHNAKFEEIVEDLNIKSVEPSSYRVEAKFDNGVILAEEVALNLFERAGDSRSVELRNANRSFYFSFLPRDLTMDDDGVIRVPVNKLTPCDDDGEDFDELPLSVTLTLIGQPNYAFDGTF